MESMNNKDPFETYLKKQSFTDKASDSLRLKLEASANWNRPWWKNSTSLVLLAALLAIILVILSVYSPSLPEQMPQQVVDEKFSPEPEPEPSRVIAKKINELLPLFYQQRLASELTFNLVFIDRPVNFVAARIEYADLI